jgi:hypothetical protein
MNSVLEGRMFTPVEGGYILRLPAGIFHRTQPYWVTEAQRAQILAVMEPERGRWIRWGTRSALALAVACGVAVDQAAGEPLRHSFLVSFSVFLAAQTIGTSMAYYAVWRRLLPLLAGLPQKPPQATITTW